METLLISEELFRENSPVKEDTVITKFIPYIGIAQRLYIERVLGRPLVEELQEQINAATAEGATGGEIPPANQALLEMIAPPLSFYAVYQGLPSHWGAIVNKGVTLRASENSTAVGLSDLAQLRRWMRDDADTLLRDLVDYLDRCAETYPLWQPDEGCGCRMGNEGTRRVPSGTGIYIPKGGWR